MDWSEWFSVGPCHDCCCLCCDGGCCFSADTTVTVAYTVDISAIAAACPDCDLSEIPTTGGFTIDGGAAFGPCPDGNPGIVWTNGAGQIIYYSCGTGWGFRDPSNCAGWGSSNQGIPSGWGGACDGSGLTPFSITGNPADCIADPTCKTCVQFAPGDLEGTITFTITGNGCT